MKLPALGMAIVFLVGPAVARAQTLEESVQSLKDAVAKKDVDAIKSLAATIRPMTDGIIAEPAPAGGDEKKDWEARVEYAKSTQLYVESAFYTVAVQAEPAVTVDLLSTLGKQNPKSKYLNQGFGAYLVALDKAGDKAKIPAIAEKGLASFPENDDLLLYMTETAYAKKPPQLDRALAFANRLTAAINKHGKPEGMPAADWERKKNAELGYGYYTAGTISFGKGVYVAADKNLRAAVPLLQGQPDMLAPALLYLGRANYNLAKMTNNKAKMLEAAKFCEQSMAIPGQYQNDARHDSLVMKDEAARMR